MKSLIIFICISFVGFSVQYKVLVYSPLFGHSHVKFMAAIADTLAEAGNDVTVLMPRIEEKNGNKTCLSIVKNVIMYETDARSIDLTRKFTGTPDKEGEFPIWKMTPSLFSLFSIVQMASDILRFNCQKMMNDKELIAKLKAEKFDLGIAEPFGICGFALFDELGIPASISASSTSSMPIVSYVLGEPQFVSHVPGVFSDLGEKMTILQRMKNLFASWFGYYFGNKIFTEELAIIESAVGRKDYRELLSKVAFSFINSHPYLDFPAPTLPKTVLVGGITVSPKAGKLSQLSEKWNEILSRRSKNVLISFGSNVRSMEMPPEYKKSFLAMFKSMPDVTFIWKYEQKNATIADGLKNVVLTTWMPQTQILADPRLTLFITHGGLGSSIELAHSGKPAVIVPVMGDQKRNAEMLLRHEVALPLQKEDLEHADKLISVVRAIMENDKYRRNAERLAELLASRPTSSKELVVSHCALAAKFVRLPEIDSLGRQLNLAQYYLVDVIALIALIIISIPIILFYVWKFTRRFLCASKEKID